MTGWSSRAWLTDFLKQPDAPKYFGHTKKLHGMKPVKAEGDELRALVEWIYAQGGGTFDRALADQGGEIFKRDDCDECHSADGKSEGVDGAPNFAGRGSVDVARRGSFATRARRRCSAITTRCRSSDPTS